MRVDFFEKVVYVIFAEAPKTVTTASGSATPSPVPKFKPIYVMIDNKVLVADAKGYSFMANPSKMVLRHATQIPTSKGHHKLPNIPGAPSSSSMKKPSIFRKTSSKRLVGAVNAVVRVAANPLSLTNPLIPVARTMSDKSITSDGVNSHQHHPIAIPSDVTTVSFHSGHSSPTGSTIAGLEAMSLSRELPHTGVTTPREPESMMVLGRMAPLSVDDVNALFKAAIVSVYACCGL